MKKQGKEGGELDLKIYDALVPKIDWRNPEKFFKSLTSGEQMILTTMFLEFQVYNGGFNQYFWNASGFMPEMAANGYILIGAKKLANLVGNAVTMFMSELPQNEKYIKENTKESFVESYKHTNLGKLDKKLYALVEEENPAKLRAIYIQTHEKEFDQSQPQTEKSALERVKAKLRKIVRS